MRTLLILLLSAALAPAFAADKGALKNYSMKHGGHKRTWKVYEPAGLADGEKYPVYFLLHGGGGKAEGMRRLTRGAFEKAGGAIVVYPQGLDEHWNDYRGDKSRKAQRENIDDVAFLKAVLDSVLKRYPGDPSRVYAAGISNGAMMSHTLACRAADRFAAVAPVAGVMPVNLASDCEPSRPVPLLIIGGDKDNLVHWEGGQVTGPFGKKKLGAILSAEKTRDFWLDKNSCDISLKSSGYSDPDPEDGLAVSRERYGSCAGGAAVEFIRIHGGGHTWPGGLQYMPAAVVGKTSRDLDASEEIVKFFSRFRLGGKE
ncbi:MAG TPA: phospholipase [Elusimicrobia bacterium]|nr:phospholipase [Elusimicrobiota bacterium]